MGLRKRPYAFTEQGVAMLSGILHSRRAIQVNIMIMRTFTKLRELMIAHKDLRLKIEEMERKYGLQFKRYDHQFKIIFETIKRLLELPEEPREPIGFHPGR